MGVAAGTQAQDVREFKLRLRPALTTGYGFAGDVFE
jgi:hypothetical protein